MQKLIKLAFIFCVIGLPAHAASSVPKKLDKKMWFYFDLGNTVINTNDFKHLHYFPGVREYMHRLRAAGIKIGVITNIPESWGMNYPQKLMTLKKVIADGWAEPQNFEWEMFDQIILPMKDSGLKPAPALFLTAIQVAQGCPSAYIGESPNEIAAAQNVGMAAKLFTGNDPEIYVDPTRVREFLIRNYRLKYDLRCLLRNPN